MQGGTVSQDAYAQYKEDFILRQDRKFFHQYKDEEWLQVLRPSHVYVYSASYLNTLGTLSSVGRA